MIGVLRTCLTYFPVLILGLVGTGALTVWAATPPPVYFSQTDAEFLAPISVRNPNSLTSASESLISLAGVTQREIDRAEVGERTSSPKITLVDQGILHGTRVRVPDSGGQWEHNYSRPVLDIQVSGSDRDEVTRRALATQQRVADVVADRQRRAHVAQQDLIRVEMFPQTPGVDLVRGRPARAIATSIVLGLSLTVVACSTASRLLGRSRTRSLPDHERLRHPQTEPVG